MKLISHLAAAAIITIIIGLIYASVQQNFRSNANDPQIQVGHDMKRKMENNKDNRSVFMDTIDLQQSLAVFVETYDQKGDPIQSSGFLNGRMPMLPRGVLDFVDTYGEDWITWQPRPDVRLATGILKVNAPPVNYLVVGRSLREVESRISRLIKMVLVSWALCMAIVLMSGLFQYYFGQKKKMV